MGMNKAAQVAQQRRYCNLQHGLLLLQASSLPLKIPCRQLAGHGQACRVKHHAQACKRLVAPMCHASYLTLMHVPCWLWGL